MQSLRSSSRVNRMQSLRSDAQESPSKNKANLSRWQASSLSFSGKQTIILASTIKLRATRAKVKPSCLYHQSKNDSRQPVLQLLREQKEPAMRSLFYRAGFVGLDLERSRHAPMKGGGLESQGNKTGEGTLSLKPFLPFDNEKSLGPTHPHPVAGPETQQPQSV